VDNFDFSDGTFFFLFLDMDYSGGRHHMSRTRTNDEWRFDEVFLSGWYLAADV
jgi:hypothetical protein